MQYAYSNKQAVCSVSDQFFQEKNPVRTHLYCILKKKRESRTNRNTTKDVLVFKLDAQSLKKTFSGINVTLKLKIYCHIIAVICYFLWLLILGNLRRKRSYETAPICFSIQFIMGWDNPKPMTKSQAFIVSHAKKISSKRNQFG